MKPSSTALLIFILSLLAVHGSWLYSLITQSIPPCFPYTGGCVSISRAARSSDGIFFFKTIMYVVAPLLIWYWHCAFRALVLHSSNAYTGIKVMRILGSIGAIFLVLYIYNLGLDGDFYRWLRRYGVTVYFSFTALAQILFVQRLLIISKHAHDAHVTKLARAKLTFCALQWALGLASIPLGLILSDDAGDRMNNIVEWNFAICMNMVFLVSFFLFRHWRLPQR